MFNNTKVEKYIYCFLKYLNKEDLWTSCSYLQHKYKLEENYSYSIIEECVKANYIDGVLVQNNASNGKRITTKSYIYITREGFKFMYNYNQAKINFWWIPLKNLIIIIVTAIITALVTYLFKS